MSLRKILSNVGAIVALSASTLAVAPHVAEAAPVTQDARFKVVQPDARIKTPVSTASSSCKELRPGTKAHNEGRVTKKSKTFVIVTNKCKNSIAYVKPGKWLPDHTYYLRTPKGFRAEASNFPDVRNHQCADNSQFTKISFVNASWAVFKSANLCYRR